VSKIEKMPSRRLKAGFAAAAVVITLAGCASGKWGFPYKAPIQQGNWVTSEQVALLQPGMSREQVRFALGSPTLTSVLHSDRWDFPYYYKPGYGAAQERKLTVWFQDDRLVRWTGDEQPNAQPFQIADQDVKRSEKEDAATADDAERARNDEGRAITPRLSITPPGDSTVQPPNAVPGTTPVQPL